MRRAEVIRMRNLMAYKTQKATREKKIKSKTYRRIRNKSIKTQEEKILEVLKGQDNDFIDWKCQEYLATDPEAAREELQRMEMERISERISLKHKNTSKWVKENLKRGKNIDPNSRQDILYI